MIEEFDLKTYKSFTEVQDSIRYLMKTFPENSYVTPKEGFKNGKYTGVLKWEVIGYVVRNGKALLMLNKPFPNNQSQRAHPANVQLDAKYIRNEKLKGILDEEV
jgi:hypothetical protein